MAISPLPVLPADAPVWAKQLVLSLQRNLAELDARKQGTYQLLRPVSLTVADLPTLSATETAIAYCSDETGGGTLVLWDGSNWKRVQDLATAS